MKVGGILKGFVFLDHWLFTKLHCIFCIIQFIYHVRNFTIHVKEQLKEVLFTIMVNRDIFEKQNTFSMYITTTDECVHKHLKNPSPQADNETDDAPSDHVQASIGTVITKATTLPILGLT